MNLRQGDFGLWMSGDHYSGYGRDRYEREHNLPSRWPGQRPRYVSAEIDTLVALCDELPAHKGHPFIAVWDGQDWQAVGHVWDDGHVEIKGTSRPEKYDRRRRGEIKWSLPGDPPFDAIAKDDVPTKYVDVGQAEQVGENPAAAGDSPEVNDAVAAIDEISRPRMPQRPSRLTAAENKAVEQHAVRLVRDYLESELHYETEDVGAFKSYDIHATKAGSPPLMVEVKGTTSDGSEVVLTANEVRLHNAEYPNTAFAVVCHIALDKAGPTTSGGTLDLKMPWKPDPDRLHAIAYRYRTH
jgi:Domain of unknown function (DUF3883)